MRASFSTADSAQTPRLLGWPVQAGTWVALKWTLASGCPAPVGGSRRRRAERGPVPARWQLCCWKRSTTETGLVPPWPLLSAPSVGLGVRAPGLQPKQEGPKGRNGKGRRCRQRDTWD